MRLLIAGMICFLLAETVSAQHTPEKKRENPTATDPVNVQVEVPKLTIHFGDPRLITGASASPLIGSQAQCSSEGSIFMKMPIPPFYRESKVVAIAGDNTGKTFSLSMVPNDLHDIGLFDYFATKSEVAFLVTATKDADEQEFHYSAPDGKSMSGKGYRGEHHNYLILYDRQGSYKSTIDLPADVRFHKLAELDSGEFLLMGYNPNNRVGDLRLFSSSGQPLRSLALPPSLADDPAVLQSETGGVVEVAKAQMAISMWQFASANGRIVLLRPGSAKAVLEIGAGGYLREAPIDSPPGYELDSFVPSNDRWLVRYRRKDLSQSGPIDNNNASGNFLLYDVNPRDGSLRTQLVLTGLDTVPAVACEADGVAKLVSTDDKLNFRIAVADLPR